MQSSKSNRRNFISQIAGASILLSISLAFDIFANEKLEKVRTVSGYIPPYLQNLRASQVSIVVIEPEDTVTWLEINDGVSTKKIINSKDGFFEAGKGVKKFLLENLSPGKTYTYKVLRTAIPVFKAYGLELGETTQSEVYNFSTLDEDLDIVSCLVLNDIHDRPNTFKDLITLQKESYDFVVFNGDTFNYQTGEQQIINHLINPISKLFATEKPFIMVRGNHETRGEYARAFKDYFVYPQDEYYFNFQQGSVHFIVLDTGEDKPDNDPAYAGIVNFDSFREKQAIWLEDVLKRKASKKSPFNVVFMHIPTYHSGDWHGTMHCRKLFAPIFEKYKVDVVISGHTHKYGIHRPNQDHSFPIVIGGGPSHGERTLINLIATKSKLTVSIRNENGTVADELNIEL